VFEYALHVSGGQLRLKEKFLNIPIYFHRLFAYILVTILFIILLSTDLLIAPPMYYEPTGWEHSYGGLFLLLMSIGMYVSICMYYILWRGLKSSSNYSERKFIIITFAAFISVQLFGYTPGMILPLLGFQTHSFSAFGWLLMCFVLTYGLLKNQLETIQNLNLELEEKVDERTSELKIANENLKRIQNQISKYVDHKIAEKIFKGELKAKLSHRRAKLTMFFSDIKDFTQFTDSSDPEDVAKILNEYLGEMALIVRKWGGTIPQFTGDCIYAIFGAPDSKGEKEDALACLRMALDMQIKMKNLRNKWWNQGIQLPFKIRCGIHTGMANVGNYGSEGFMEYSAIGLNTNLASRLEQACEPGEIYLSHASWAMVKDKIPCDEVGTIEVKGFHYPIQTYRVVQDDIDATTSF
jgi:class 3 adenylate cyclase